MSIDSAEFRKALGSFVTGVTIVTTCDQDGNDVGLTANSFNSVSLNPPLVLWSLDRTSASMPAFEQSQAFVVHVLAGHQEDLSNRFAKRGKNKFDGLLLERGINGVPVLPDCSARFECRTTYMYEGGDHVIFVGEVVSFSHTETRPLAYHGGRYALPSAKQLRPVECETVKDDGSFNEDFLGYLLGKAHFRFYSRLRPHLAAHRLTSAQHFVLGILGNLDGSSVVEIDALLEDTGERVTPALMNSLVTRGLLSRTDEEESPRLWLTPQGRRTMVELSAASKAAEAEVQKHFNEDEFGMLKHLLKELMRNTPSLGYKAPTHSLHLEKAT